MVLFVDVPSEVDAVFKFILRKAVAHEAEAIAAGVSDVEVFRADLFDHIVKEHGTACESGSDPSICAVILVPRSTYTHQQC